jgi:hypothetical protein
MLRRLDIKLILSLTVLIVAISCIGGCVTFRLQKQRLVETMVTGADQLSRSITSATWPYEIMRVIADKHGVDRIRMFNRPWGGSPQKRGVWGGSCRICWRFRGGHGPSACRRT